MVRYFVPEVNSSEEDLQSIINDLLKYDAYSKILYSVVFHKYPS